MAAQVYAVLLLLGLGLSAGPGLSSSSDPSPDSERGRMQLRRVQGLAAQPRYGGCWARALEHLDTRCRDMTSESQSRIALSFTLCHLSSSGRDFPSCPEGSEVSRCTGVMDAVAFNTYTEFFTHTHSICHFLQSDAWQGRAEDTMYRLTESSAGVAEQLQSTRQMAEDLIDAQTAALQAQQEILNNGEELRVTLRDSTQGLRSVFSELSSVSREQQVALSELFNRVSFLQSFLLMEAHSLSSCCYNAAALCTAFLITSTQRSSRARYRDPLQQSLQVLQQLRETQRSLQEALQHAESLGNQPKNQLPVKRRSEGSRREEALRRREEIKRGEEEVEEEEEECSTLVSPHTDDSDLSHLTHIGWSADSFLSSTVNSSAADVTQKPYVTHNASVLSPTTQKASVSPGRRPRRSSSSRLPSTSSSSSPLVYSILVEDKQPRYSLRSRRSETH